MLQFDHLALLVCKLIARGDESDHISLPEDILHGGGPLPGDRLLTVCFEELPICWK
jgi:hypothetical protein